MKKTGTFLLLRDNARLGLVLGFVLPILIFMLLYFYRFASLSFSEFLPFFISENRLITFFGAWCLVGNIALFTFYINSNRYETAKGIFVLSVVWGVLVLLLKWWN